ncbi:sensory transduction/ GGDEF family protein [Marinomonas sp. MED121]|uniref:sensor domain-containing diguanylate cyclase n=1 Tax=Marinomonas sp. MED121 TaxID=314277 RepID=UPI000068FD02|nr:sensor domain-containing diguanylate cyclase [Marinomonas sp. MED121]EAQ63111.1 sensory transduction/ GGDEF family protein [Marinomonas sp. MED121]
MIKKRTDLIDPNYGMVIHRDFIPLYADDNYAQFFGFKNGEEITKLESILPLVNDEQRDVSIANYKGLMQGDIKPQVRSFRHLNQAGEEFFILAIEHIVDWEGQPALQVTYIDISALTQAETKIYESEQKFRDLIEGSIQGMVIHQNFKPLMVNQAYANMHGYDSPQEILDLPDISIFFTPNETNNYIERAALIMSDQEVNPKKRFKNTRKDGSTLWVELIERRIVWNNQDAIQTTLIDVTGQVEMEKKLTLLAMTDSLTGLFNRRFLMEKSAQIFDLQQSLKLPLACILIDLDKFKRVNDKFGHNIGDEILKAFSNRCQRMIQEPHIIGRYGGEEFLVVMPNTNPEDAVTLANTLRQMCDEEAIETGAGDLKVTMSAGISTLNTDDTHFDQLVDRADKRLYEAKALGRNRVVSRLG